MERPKKTTSRSFFTIIVIALVLAFFALFVNNEFFTAPSKDVSINEVYNLNADKFDKIDFQKTYYKNQ